MDRMNRTLLVLAALFAATAAHAQDTGRRGVPQGGVQTDQPATRMPREDESRVQRPRSDQYILHDRATRRGGSVDSGYGLDLRMTPRRPAPSDHR